MFTRLSTGINKLGRGTKSTNIFLCAPGCTVVNCGNVRSYSAIFNTSWTLTTIRPLLGCEQSSHHSNNKLANARRHLQRRLVVHRMPSRSVNVTRYLSTSGRTCWSCGERQYYKENETSGLFFCSSCSKVLPVDSSVTYFSLMNCSEDFNLNTDVLTKKYRNLQTSLHPDKFSQKSALEQGHSAEQSALVNRAYQTLLDPLSRGVYMLELHNYEIKEDNSSSDPSFLNKMFEINETLMECTSAIELKKMDAEIEDSIDKILKKASVAFRNRNYAMAKEMIIELTFYYNVKENIKERLPEM